MKQDGEGRKMFLEIDFYLQHGIFGFAFGAARLVKCCEYGDEIELWEVEMAACVVEREGLCFLHFWRKTCCSCRNWTLDVTVSFVSGIWGEVSALGGVDQLKTIAIEERPVWHLHWSAFSSQRDWVWPHTRFGSRKWRSGVNRISHPDWVKLSVELNCVPNQNTKFSPSLQTIWTHIQMPP